MGEGTRLAQMEETMHALRWSQEALKGTTNQHSSLLAEIIQRPEDLKGSSRDDDPSKSKTTIHKANSFGSSGSIQARTMK
ncbi:hypothetical protein MRB53_015999 [Persea americana]|uniref:Uncharacterized protein n=1 Tax=Persea americana TaxID=3435 RepID=A0ACC2M0Y6_PERAE|nr:hypothetical protein MRB53_015999 [Persea americana]